MDQIEEAADQRDWEQALRITEDLLVLDPLNHDAADFRSAALRALGRAAEEAALIGDAVTAVPGPPAAEPESFADGRYQVKRFLGEGGKKMVYLAHDTLLDREVAFTLIKTDGLDETSRARIQREAQAMGRLGSHPHIVIVFDLGKEQTKRRFFSRPWSLILQ